ncbi:MAG: SCP2 sterol-binding domain-containing protein [Acidimicrobiales bacterium]
MPRFYSKEWVAAFNEAVEGLEAGTVDTGASLAADGGRFRVDQVVHGAPGGDVVVALDVDDGRMHLELEPAGDGRGNTGAAVVVSLSYDDAAAMARGELEPASAVAEGRIRVRGDLAVLVAGQALMVAAAERLAGLRADTTY